VELWSPAPLIPSGQLAPSQEPNLSTFSVVIAPSQLTPTLVFLLLLPLRKNFTRKKLFDMSASEA
jgi:hypothetical protein